jgi:SOS-response transcriptional repressor LexA
MSHRLKNRVRIENPQDRQLLTSTEDRVYRAYLGITKKSPVNPSLEEIGAAVKPQPLSTSQVSRAVSALVRKGWLLSDPGKYRSLRVAYGHSGRSRKAIAVTA